MSATAPTKRELELELQVWQARAMAVQNGVAAINAQAQNLQREAKECESEIARATAALKAYAEEHGDGVTKPLSAVQ